MGTVAPLELPRDRWTLVEAARLQADRLGDREFLSFAGEGPLTFAELHAESDRIAGALAGLGVGPGDRVLALAGNSKAFVLAMLATHKQRAVFTPINTELRGAFLEHQLRNSAPKVVVVDEDLLALFDHVAPGGTGVEHTVVVGGPAGRGGPGSGSGQPTVPAALQGGAVHRWDGLVDGAGEGRSARQRGAVGEPAPSDICTIMYTSGTTGPSKGVLMPQAHCFLFAKGAAEAVRLTEADRYYVCMPFFHANALLMQVFACLVAGAPATVVRRFSVSSWLDDVIASGATVSNALGVMPEFIYRQPPTDRDRAHRLTRMLALPIADEWGEDFERRFGVRILQGYGMTEVNMVAYTDWSDPPRSGCAGRVAEDLFEVVVADPDTDDPLPAGETGEILVRPRLPFCFNQGYFAMPDKTVEAYRNLWFHTGDAGRFDEDGRLHFVDRLRDRIRRRGENVSSYEVEQVLNQHPAVVESAAVGVRVEGAGGEEEIKACVVLAGDPVDPVELLDWCRERMPRFAVPRFVEFVDELDKTPSGKVRKQVLRDAGVGPTTWDREAAGYQLPR